MSLGIKDRLRISQQSFDPITRHTLALYAGGSGDYNPIHVDRDFAIAAGMSDVFAHGMLVAAYAMRALMTCFSQSEICNFEVKFLARTNIHDVLRCDIYQCGLSAVDNQTKKIEFEVKDQADELKLAGEALVIIK